MMSSYSFVMRFVAISLKEMIVNCGGEHAAMTSIAIFSAVRTSIVADVAPTA